MSEALQIAAFLLVAGAIAALAKLLWEHVQHCKEIHGRLASIEGKVDQVVTEIGTHDTGMRGTIHRTENVVTVLRGQMDDLRRQEMQR